MDSLQEIRPAIVENQTYNTLIRSRVEKKCLSLPVMSAITRTALTGLTGVKLQGDEDIGDRRDDVCGLVTMAMFQGETRSRSIAPYYSNGLILDYGINDFFTQHANAFVDWRYLHEPKNTTFRESEFIATLEMVLREFKKRYRVVDMPSVWPSG